MIDTIRLPRKGAVKMIAHRGASSLEPENSMPAFVAACNRSYYGIETDVHVTADGQFVILHDSDTGRVAHESFIVEQTPWDLLREVTLRDLDGAVRTDLRLPLYSDYLKLCVKYGKVPVVELKGVYSDAAIDAFLECSGTDYPGVFISFHEENLMAIRSKRPDAKLQYLTGGWDSDVRAFLFDYRLDLDISWGGLVTEDGQTLDSSLIDSLHRAGKTVNVWTVDDVATAEKVIDAGADLITSNTLE